MRDFLKVGGTRAKFVMLCTILSALFVLVVPAWVSAMTGYTADIEGFVQDSNNNLAPATDFRPAVYTIHDGDRVGFTKDYHVAIPWPAGYIYLSVSSSYGCDQDYHINYTTTQEEFTREGYWGNHRMRVAHCSGGSQSIPPFMAFLVSMLQRLSSLSQTKPTSTYPNLL